MSVARVVARFTGIGALAFALDFRVSRSRRPLDTRWQDVAVEARRGAQLGISFRPLQAEALGLAPRRALAELLDHPFQVVRLAAYWDRLEGAPGRFEPAELDWQIDAAEKAGKSVIVCTGAVKAFGYPEFFAPAHTLTRALREGSLVRPSSHPELLAGAACFTQRVVERYRDRSAVVAWQVEHEALDPLGIEHSWRLSASFVAAELDVVRESDPLRPIVMNCFAPTSSLVAVSQRWRTRGQGDSLAGALRSADIVGIDFYPRNALFSFGPLSVYLDGRHLPWHRSWRRRISSWAASREGSDRGAQGGGHFEGSLSRGGRRALVTEGQAEPWETATVPPMGEGGAMASCPPERVIENYNECMRWQCDVRYPLPLLAYLFWGAEYWLARREAGDPSYMRAFERVLACA